MVIEFPIFLRLNFYIDKPAIAKFYQVKLSDKV